MNTFIKFLEIKGINQEKFEGMTSIEQNKLYQEHSEDSTEAYSKLKESADTTKEQLQDAQKTITESKEEYSTFKASVEAKLETQGLALSKVIHSDSNSTIKSFEQEVIEKKNDIIAVAKRQKKEVTIKALTNRAAVTNNALGVFIPEITQLGYKERSLYNVLPKITIADNNTHGVIRYRDWDEATTVRAAAMVAEGAAFPESTAKFQWYTKDLRKIGDTLPVTEEFFEDEAQAASELGMFLDINVNLVVNDQLVNGDNTGQNLDGIYNASPAYTAVASGIPSPNLKDLVIKMRNDITRTRGSKYSPDMVLVNSSTMEDLILAKDANNNYIFDENTGTLGGMPVVIDENVADNAILVGDRRYARIYEKTGVTLSEFMPNGQFLEDEMTIKARKRLLLLIKEGDKTGFRKVTDVAAALITLAS